MPAKNATPGITTRHRAQCPARDGGRCRCKPTYRASVYDARSRKKIRKVFKSHAEAKQWQTDKRHAAKHGTLRPRSATTVRDEAVAFLEGARAGLIPDRSGKQYKASTLRGYARWLDRDVLPELGHIRISDLTREDVQELADKLARSGRSPSSVKNVLDALRVICRRAVRKNLIAVNPTTDLELRKARGRRERVADPEEAARLLDALPETERALWATAFYTGLRRGELQALRWKNVDLAAGEISVCAAWDAHDGEIETKSAAGVRTIAIIADLARDLAAHGLRTGRDGDDLVFGRTADLPFVPTTVRSRALRAWAAANTAEAERLRRDLTNAEALRPIGLHECRHTYASTMLAAGGNLLDVKEAMGHSTIVMTCDQYGHLMDGRRREIADQMDAYLAARAVKT